MNKFNINKKFNTVEYCTGKFLLCTLPVMFCFSFFSYENYGKIQPDANPQYRCC